MITAVDTNVLLDVLSADRSFGEASRTVMRRCLDEGAMIASEVVWAETAAWFRPADEMTRTLTAIGIRFEPLDEATARSAGKVWRRYRDHGGPRQRVLPDFLIGAHAMLQADRLLTRDRGFYRRYFRDLELVDPTTA